MGSVIPLKKSANSAYLELKNLLSEKLEKVEELIELKLKSDIKLIEQMSEHHLKSGGKRLRALLTLESAKLTGCKEEVIETPKEVDTTLNTSFTDELVMDVDYVSKDFLTDGVGEVTLVSCISLCCT